MSTFDYPDPGMDPAYCDGLEAEPDESNACVWCNELYTDQTSYPYCSAACAVRADSDSLLCRYLNRWAK